MPTFKPQEGFQQRSLSTNADIAIIGGSAGGGKTWLELYEFLRHKHVPGFNAVIFRRTTPQIKNPGGLWDTSNEIYPYAGGIPNQTQLRWSFPISKVDRKDLPTFSSIKFSHIEHESNLMDWQGGQICYIGFDELTHFTERMFFYMLSRNRSLCGVRPYVRASCNPDPDSWVAKFIEWWIDQETGLAIPERAGKIRYMTRDGETIIWGDTIEEVIAQCPHVFQNEALLASGVNPTDLIKSVTFIPGSIYENQILIKKDPAYLGNLLALPPQERAQLLDGNWKIRLDGLGLFDFNAGRNLFSNFLPEEKNPPKYITVDPARFGRDLCVIMVWRGWEVIHTSIFTKSDVHDIYAHIEQLRMKFFIVKSNVLVDQDGVGGGVVKLAQGYRGFHGGSKALKDPVTRKPENYKNLKTQCYYRIANRINDGMIRYSCTADNVLVHDDSKLTGSYSLKVKVGSKVHDVRDLIKSDLNAVKRAKSDMEGKFQINPKDGDETSMKAILGRSPDFGDTLMMRESFELMERQPEMKRMN